MPYSVGCKELRIGAKGTGGIMGTALTAVVPYKETIKFTGGDTTFTAHYGENQKYPDVVVAESTPGDFSFELHNLTKANLAAYVGGTAGVTAEEWSDGIEHFSVEKSMEIDTIFDETWQYARVLLSGRIEWSVDRKNIARIIVKGMILKPEDATEATPPVKKIATVV
jgi:hypothetical protein